MDVSAVRALLDRQVKFGVNVPQAFTALTGESGIEIRFRDVTVEETLAAALRGRRLSCL